MCGDAIAAVEFDHAWKLVIGAAFVLIAIEAADDAYEEFEEALEDLLENANRQLEISLTLKDLWLENQHQRKLKALIDTLAMDIPERSYAEAWSMFQSVANTVSNQAKNIRSRLVKQYGLCGLNRCDRTLDVAQGVASANAAYAFYRAGERRTERRRSLKRKLVQSAQAASYADPGPMFALLQNAASIFGSNLQSAYSHLGGAASLGGIGLGMVFSGLGGLGNGFTPSTNTGSPTGTSTSPSYPGPGGPAGANS